MSVAGGSSKVPEAKNKSEADLDPGYGSQSEANTIINIYSKNDTPLQRKWSFWKSSCISGSTRGEYENQLEKMTDISTVKEFWESYNSLPRPSDLYGRMKICLMRGNVAPLWEDPLNHNGGSFVARVQKFDMEWMWEQLLLLAVGEELNEHFVEDELCGLTLCVKRTVFVLSFWNRLASSSPFSTLHAFLLKRFPNMTIYDWFYNPHRRHSAYEENRALVTEMNKLELVDDRVLSGNGWML